MYSFKSFLATNGHLNGGSSSDELSEDDEDNVLEDISRVPHPPQRLSSMAINITFGSFSHFCSEIKGSKGQSIVRFSFFGRFDFDFSLQILSYGEARVSDHTWILLAANAAAGGSNLRVSSPPNNEYKNSSPYVDGATDQVDNRSANASRVGPTRRLSSRGQFG